jgi:predicted O-methyltransferase YrrM
VNNVQEFLDKKNNEIDRLTELKAKLKQEKDNHKNLLAEIEREEAEIKVALEKFEEEQNDLSIDVIVNDWIETRDNHAKKFIQPALDKAFKAKSQYRAALEEVIKSVDSLNAKQNVLTSMMERENMSLTDIGRIKTTERFRPNYPDYARIIIADDDFEDLNYKISYIFGR